MSARPSSWLSTVHENGKLGKLFGTAEKHEVIGSLETYQTLLQGCIKQKDLVSGRSVLCLLTCNGLVSHPSFGPILISMFSTCGSLQEAQWVFSRLAHPNLFAWTSIISAHAKLGSSEHAIDMYHQIHLVPDQHLFVAVLKACTTGEHLLEGMLFHGHIIECGLDAHTVVGNALIEVYIKCGNFEDGEKVFSHLSNPSVITWSIILTGLVELTRCWEAMLYFWQMLLHAEVEPDNVIFVNALKACSSLHNVDQGRLVHSVLVEGSHEKSLPIYNSLIDTYAKCNSLLDARCVFDRSRMRSTMTWNAIIATYMQHEGQDQEAICLLHQMKHDGFQPTRLTWNIIIAGLVQQGVADKAFQLFSDLLMQGIKPDPAIHISMLKGCADIRLTWTFHAHIVETYYDMDTSVRNTLIDTYARCRSSLDACYIFNSSSKRNIVTWTVMINCFLLDGYYHEAFLLFEKMNETGLEPNRVTFLGMLKACSTHACMVKGRSTHDYIIKSNFETDEFVCNSLVVMYSRCGLLDDAYRVFRDVSQKSVVTWTAMISGYSQSACVLTVARLFQQMQDEGVQSNVVTWNAMLAGFSEQGHSEDAVEIFYRMQKEGHEPDDVTFISVLKACGNLALLNQGELIHSQIIEEGYECDLPVMNTLVDMYAKCGSILHSRRLFDKLPKQDIVTWNAMLSGYSHYEDDQQALLLLEELEQDGMSPDQTTCLNILSACSSLLALNEGKLIHSFMIENELALDMLSCNALIDMYAKCGSINDAYTVFEATQNRDVITWSTLAIGYTQQNNFESAVEVFEQMKFEGLKPDDVSFLGLLSACTQMGLLHEGCRVFSSMSEDHNLTPKLVHFNCVVALVANAGCWSEVEDLLQTTPFQLDTIALTSLLSHCRSHGNVGLGERFFEQLNSIGSRDAAGIHLMSSIYSDACMLDNANQVSGLRQFSNSWKKPGKAFIEVNNITHGFVVGDTTHMQSDAIHAKLHSLYVHMKGKGYAPYYQM